jgi:hypothetical protein
MGAITTLCPALHARNQAAIWDTRRGAACVVHPDRPVIHLSGDSAIGLSGMEMETLVRYNFPAKIVVLNNGASAPACPRSRKTRLFNVAAHGRAADRCAQAQPDDGLVARPVQLADPGVIAIAT